jgi:hypothetical protein
LRDLECGYPNAASPERVHRVLPFRQRRTAPLSLRPADHGPRYQAHACNHMREWRDWRAGGDRSRLVRISAHRSRSPRSNRSTDSIAQRCSQPKRERLPESRTVRVCSCSHETLAAVAAERPADGGNFFGTICAAAQRRGPICHANDSVGWQSNAGASAGRRTHAPPERN